MRGAVAAHARLTAAAGGALPVLSGDGPLALRRTGARGPTAQVTLVGAMSAPLGGDRLRLTVELRLGAALRVTSAAATVALPGPEPGAARYDTRLTVADDAELCWLPEPVISAAGSELTMTTHIELAATARLRYREEQVLGRAGEPPGRLTTRLTVHRAGRPLLDQELCYGPGAAPGWDGGAVLGGHRAVGQLLVVDPAFDDEPSPGPWRPASRPPAAAPLGDTAVIAPLAGPAVLLSAVAPDALTLRRLLAEGAARIDGAGPGVTGDATTP